MSPTPRRKWYLTTGRRAHWMVLDPIPQSLPVHFFGSRPQPPTSPTSPRHGRHRKISQSWSLSQDVSVMFDLSLSGKISQSCRVCVGVYLYIHVNIHMDKCIYIYLSLLMRLLVCVHLYMRIYICIYIHLYTYMWTCIYMVLFMLINKTYLVDIWVTYPQNMHICIYIYIYKTYTKNV